MPPPAPAPRQARLEHLKRVLASHTSGGAVCTCDLCVHADERLFHTLRRPPLAHLDERGGE